MQRLNADVIVVGAGVIGLAAARAFARSGRDVTILEAESTIAAQTSSRNSQVIHAGIYYPPRSLKAYHCVKGRRLLFDYLKERSIACKRCGKLIIAQDCETENLQKLFHRARINGVEGIRLISGQDARVLEPRLSPTIAAAIHSTVSGIFDSHAYCLALQADIENQGGMIAFKTPVEGGEIVKDGVELVTGGLQPARIRARLVINAAGHNAVRVAARIAGEHVKTLPKTYYIKGSYFSIRGNSPFSRLIYPMPDETSLGLHFTIDLGGRGKLGPDAEWLDQDTQPPFSYRVDPERADYFCALAQNYWPALRRENLEPAYAGIRPKLAGPGEPVADFHVSLSDGCLINLFGIESPGLTASLSLADHLASMSAANT